MLLLYCCLAVVMGFSQLKGVKVEPSDEPSEESFGLVVQDSYSLNEGNRALDGVSTPVVAAKKRRIRKAELFTCEICAKTIKHRFQFTNHMRTHSGEKPYKCDVCGRAFIELRNLNTHMRRHTGEKPYKCDVCSQSFAHLNSLKIHVRTHTGDKPYGCDVCTARFADPSTYRRHKYIHALERPVFTCDSCYKTFASRRSLVNHKCSNLPSEELSEPETD